MSINRSILNKKIRFACVNQVKFPIELGQDCDCAYEIFISVEAINKHVMNETFMIGNVIHTALDSIFEFEVQK